MKCNTVHDTAATAEVPIATGNTCSRCGQWYDGMSLHFCNAFPAETLSTDSTVAIEPGLPSLQSLIEQIGLAGYGVFVRYDTWRESKHWTIMITDKQGRRDTDEPVKILLEMWQELEGARK